MSCLELIKLAANLTQILLRKTLIIESISMLLPALFGTHLENITLTLLLMVACLVHHAALILVQGWGELAFLLQSPLSLLLFHNQAALGWRALDKTGRSLESQRRWLWRRLDARSVGWSLRLL